MREDTTPYTVQSGYWAQQEAFVSPLEWCSDIWDLKVPRSAKVFGWRALLNRLPSRVNLKRMGANSLV